MNSSNYTHGFDPYKEAAISLRLKVATLLLFGGFGAVGNIFVIVLAVKYTARKNLHHLIINMAVADTLVVLVRTCLGVMKLFRFNFWNYLPGVWGGIICRTLSFFVNVFTFESLVTLLVITVERFRVTRLTLQRSRPYTLKQRTIVLACCWLIPMVLASYHLVYRKFVRIRFGNCSCDNSRPLVLLIVWSCIRNLLVIITLCIIFILSIITLRRLFVPQAIQDHISESQRQARRKRTASVMRMVLCSLLLYTCSYLPHYIIDMLTFGYQPETTSFPIFLLEYVVFFLLPVVNSCFSPCIYIVFLPDFREASKRLLKCGRATNQRVNRRISAETQAVQAEETENNSGLRNHSKGKESQTTEM